MAGRIERTILFIRLRLRRSVKRVQFLEVNRATSYLHAFKKLFGIFLSFTVFFDEGKFLELLYLRNVDNWQKDLLFLLVLGPEIIVAI
jgi:hypothetical protein